LVTAGVVLNLAVGVLPLAVIVATSVLLARVPAAAPTGHGASLPVGLGLATSMVLAGLVAQQALAPFQTALAEVAARRIDGHCRRRLMTACAIVAPMQVLEGREALDLVGEARAGLDRAASASPGEAAAALLALLARYAQLIGAVALVGVVLGWLPGLVIGLTGLVVRFGQRGSLARFGGLWSSLDDDRRRMRYLREVGLGSAATKEIRVLGLLGWLQGRLAVDSQAYTAALWRGRRRILGRPFLVYAMVALVGGAFALIAVADAGAGWRLDALQVSVAIQAVLVPMRFGVFFPECDIQTFQGMHAYRALLALEQLASQSASDTGTAVRRPFLGGPSSRVRFEKVVFSYSEDGDRVLDGLDLDLPAGTSTAIVGLNGAGKTTLVKLLTGLYRPTAGRITVDGHDLAQLDERAWRRNLAVVFQDYTRHPLTAGENIGLGAPDRPREHSALMAAARRAGAADLLDSLPSGLDTPLSSRFSGGTELSGGQWQRVALARAFFAVDGGASLLVLDEPTAQLDVRAEAEFFDRFLELTSDLTTVLISHRFSTVRRADQIVVLDGGRVAERGDHASLLALGGRYAQLFHAQTEHLRVDHMSTARKGR
jgi:ATP-binding cassette, subfamily B, bacterial